MNPKINPPIKFGIKKIVLNNLLILILAVTINANDKPITINQNDRYDRKLNRKP